MKEELREDLDLSESPSSSSTRLSSSELNLETIMHDTLLKSCKYIVLNILLVCDSFEYFSSGSSRIEVVILV